MSKKHPTVLRGFASRPITSTLDKTMNDRKHLVLTEIDPATKGSRNEARDRCLLLLMFRHGLRVSEVLLTAPMEPFDDHLNGATS
jgi:site-specific recombinase XerD